VTVLYRVRSGRWQTPNIISGQASSSSPNIISGQASSPPPSPSSSPNIGVLFLLGSGEDEEEVVEVEVEEVYPDTKYGKDVETSPNP
jgi:hypothetical protein